MKTTSKIYLPPVPKVQDVEMRRYLEQLERALQTAFQHVYEDLSQGKATLTPYTAAPAAT